MSWNQNNPGICNNPKCRGAIWWNELVIHPRTGRQRPLNEPYYPDHNKEPVVHECMKKLRPGVFLDKYGGKVELDFVVDYSRQLSYHIHNGYPALNKYNHYERIRRLNRGIQQNCNNPNCECQWVEAQKDPLILEEWNRQCAEWLKKWENLP